MSEQDKNINNDLSKLNKEFNTLLMLVMHIRDPKKRHIEIDCLEKVLFSLISSIQQKILDRE